MQRGKAVILVGLAFLVLGWWVGVGWMTWSNNAILGNPEIEKGGYNLFWKFALYGPLGHNYLLGHCSVCKDKECVFQLYLNAGNE